MRIDIWSDVVCPWCYIGKRRLETAIGDREDIEVVFHSFQLDPSAPSAEPAEGWRPASEVVARKYGAAPEQLEEMFGRVEQLAKDEGLEFKHREAPWAGTIDAHRLLHLALAEGGPQLQRSLKEALLAAYFLEARNPADHAVLTDVAAAAGLDRVRVEQVLDSDEYAEEFAADVRQARAYGATGVPFFVIDERYGISGAQPVEVFRDVIARADADAKPLVTVTGAADGDCGSDGCAI
ncbi:DsbA family oxidoreductase [Nocardioides bigeumensis]|uniref:DsbA family oxidoreductase n=1 Tax=Nocardioides bigeumensis TaxID=433657 RepID=A0ABN2Y4S5_9ACTN